MQDNDDPTMGASPVTDETTPLMAGKTWLAALQQYDNHAWSQLYHRFAERLHHDILISVRKYGLAEDDHNDIFQETLRTAMKLIHNFTWQSEDKLYHWLRTISHRHVLTHNRRKTPVSLDALDEGDSMLDVFLRINDHIEEGPEHLFDVHEQLDLVFDALKRCHVDEMTVFVRWWLRGEKPREIASTYPHFSPNRISDLIYSAKQKIRREVNAANLLRGQ